MADDSRWWQLAYLAPTIISAFLALLSSLTPGGDFLLLGIAFLVWIWSAAGWVASLAIRTLRRPLLLIVPPLVGVLSVASVATAAPLRAALLFSESALHERARAIGVGEQREVEEGWIGVIPVSSIRRSEGFTEFTVGGGGFLITCGLAHSPGGPAKITDVTSVDHLSGDWYVTCTDFD
ncbi:hypothetical protein ACFXJ8_41300 [Nonomuraea sp. NPDC059194]|uniref:hypothetical protein n=1 Tax=Nonomuraea sp. NPDC059194 TaxID=3346764 RepID=UPI003682A07F